MRTNQMSASPHKFPDDEYVLTFATWCKVNGFCSRTGKRIIKSGEGPQFIKISAGRIGVTRGENRRWRDSRMVRGPSEKHESAA
jgi:hypothetical protein